MSRNKHRNRQKQKYGNQGGIFGQPGGAGSGKQGKGSGGGWGLGEPGAKPAAGLNPPVSPFMMPKPAGVNIFSNTFASNYYIEWNISAWRAVCDQAYNQGNMVGLATLYTWCFEKSAFIQGLFKKLGDALDSIPFYISDSKGNPLDEWTEELCNKPWLRQLRKEIMFAKFWGMTGLNFDVAKGELYKYPMQQVDPINRMLRTSTYDYANGMSFDDSLNLLFVQPSTSTESFLGMMQAISHDFILMNVTQNNWVSSGTFLAYPIRTFGYPQNDSSVDENGNIINPYKDEAERIAADSDPSKALIVPYVVNEKGDIVKSISVGFEKPGTSANQHLTFKDFNSEKKIEIQELVYGRSLSNASGKGNRALGEVEQETINAKAKSESVDVKEVLNAGFLKKIRKFYKNFPDDAQFNVDNSTSLTIPEIVQLSAVLVSNGKRFTPKFFEDQGINKEYFEDAPVGEEQKPVTDPVVQMAGEKKKF
jgi:hypothetical protein